MQKLRLQNLNLPRLAIILGAILAGLLLLLGIGYWLVVPGVADSLVRDKLKSTETKLGMSVQVEQVETDGMSAVSLRGFSIVDPDTKKTLLETDSVSASVNGLALLFGKRELSGVVVENAKFYVHRNADGTTNIDQIIARRRAQKGGTDKSLKKNAEADSKQKNSAQKSDPDEMVASFLQFFGGDWPDIDIHKARLIASADEGAEPWAIDAIETDELVLSSRGKRANFKTSLKITRGAGAPHWSVPGVVDIDATLQLPLTESTGSLKFDRPLALAGVGPYPFIRLGLGGASVEDKHKITLEGLSLGVQGDSTPTNLVSIEKIEAAFDGLKLPVSELRLMQAQIINPVFHLEYDAQSGSGLNDLLQLTRAPLAGHIIGNARDIADAIAIENDLELDPRESSGGGLRAMLAGINWSKFLAKKAPQSLTISGGAIRVVDERNLGSMGADKRIALEDGTLKFSHRVINGQLVFDGSFRAVAQENQPRGNAKFKLGWNYRNNELSFNTQVDDLSLPWLVQLTSARLADKIYAGNLHADLQLERKSKKKRIDFNGLISLGDTTVFSASIAEDPIARLNASYQMEGFFDPEMPMPEAELIKPLIAANTANQTGDADQPDLNGAAAGQDPSVDPDISKSDQKNGEDEDDAPPTRGALVFSTGHFELNGVKGEFRPAFYGLDGLKRRPNRLKMHVELPKTPVMTLFEAVPAAIKGPLEGTKMSGHFAWTLDVEAPLYHARDMQWKADPQLTGFELISMPSEVDVRKLAHEFDMTIYDPALEWSRRVTIPEMRPMPMDWMETQTGITEEEFYKPNRRRSWPTDEDFDAHISPHRLPWADERRAAEPDTDSTLTDHINSEGQASDNPMDWDDEFSNSRQARSPQGGSSQGASPQDTGAANTQSAPSAPKTAPKPAKKYRPDEIPPELLVMLDEERKQHPYGPYVFVPLQYSSPWMIRAAMTTEDNSFFKHHGFNWLAVRESIAANLNAGRYVRGASTISMQLVKNIFLTRDKVMVRKLREAFLVWLMEDVVQLPKARILELYFNVIEYGPGIFGINDAAVHYFGKRPDKLTLSEVAWLVSIVPNPKKFHFYYERGEISDSWYRRMMRYVRYMVTRERATEEEYEDAKINRPIFYKPTDGEPMIRVERDPTEVKDLIEGNVPMQLPGLRDLFGP